MALANLKIVLACSGCPHFEHKPADRSERRSDKQSKRRNYKSSETIRLKIKNEHIFSWKLTNNSRHQCVFQLERGEASFIEVEQRTEQLEPLGQILFIYSHSLIIELII